MQIRMKARECQIVQFQWVISMKREKEDQKDRYWQSWNIWKTILRHFVSFSRQREEDFRATNMLQEDYSDGMLNRWIGRGERLKARMVLSSYLHQRKFGSGLGLGQEMQKINARQQRSDLSIVSGVNLQGKMNQLILCWLSLNYSYSNVKMTSS